MSKKQFILTLIITAIFAFLGGMLSAQLFSGHVIFAQDLSKEIRAKRIIAEEFQLVDSIEKEKPIIRAALKTFSNPGETSVYEMYDWKGNIRILFIIDEEGNPAAHFWDKNADGKYNPARYPSISFWENRGKLKKVIPKTKK